MIIEQKFQTIKGDVTIRRQYKTSKPTGVEYITSTEVDAPFEEEYILDLFHRWAASVRSEDRLHRPPEQILALVGSSWQEIIE